MRRLRIALHALDRTGPPMLAAALRRLLRQADLRQSLGRAARAEMRAKYRWEAIARRYEDVYRAAQGTRAHKRGLD